MDSPGFSMEEVKIDIAEIIKARTEHPKHVTSTIAKLISDSSDLQYRTSIIQSISEQISRIEQAGASGLASLQGRLLDIYTESAERNYRARLPLRILTLGLSSEFDAQHAANCALGETKALVNILTDATAIMVETAIANREPLLEYIESSARIRNQLACQLTNALLPQSRLQLDLPSSAKPDWKRSLGLSAEDAELFD